MGRRLIVLLGLGAAAALVRRRAASGAAQPFAPPAPPPAPPAPTPAPKTPAEAVVAVATGAGSSNGHGTVVEDDDAPFGPGSAAPLEDGSAPEGFAVKAKTSSGIYHTESSPSFKRTRADVWFRTPEDAERAGFKRSGADRGR